MSSKEQKLVICQRWVESEAGWGVRPDGFSLHVGREALEKFIKEYWRGMPAAPPSEYSRPEGAPYTTGVDEDTYREVVVSGLGVRRYDTPPADITSSYKLISTSSISNTRSLFGGILAAARTEP